MLHYHTLMANRVHEYTTNDYTTNDYTTIRLHYHMTTRLHDYKTTRLQDYTPRLQTTELDYEVLVGAWTGIDAGESVGSGHTTTLSTAADVGQGRLGVRAATGRIEVALTTRAGVPAPVHRTDDVHSLTSRTFHRQLLELAGHSRPDSWSSRDTSFSSREKVVQL